MIFNAFSNFHRYTHRELRLKGNRPEPEGDQIKRFLQVTGLGREHISQASRETICQQVMSIPIKHDGIISSQSLDGGDWPDELAGKIRTALIQPDGKGTFDLTAKGFVMMELGYQLRCQLFHANKPLPLFSFADERELVFLKIVSDLLEEYLDQELYRLFDPKYVTERILPVIEKTAVKKK